VAQRLMRRGDGQAVLVKFSPPRDTPFGERWHDLLHAEALALQVLQAHGVAVAHSAVIETPARTYLVSERFDRLAPKEGRHFEGRRHAVPLHAVHDAFVSGPRHHWATTGPPRPRPWFASDACPTKRPRRCKRCCALAASSATATCTSAT
jgi:hypothetical protein